MVLRDIRNPGRDDIRAVLKLLVANKLFEKI